VLEIVVSDREKLKLLQANITGCMLNEVIWRIRNVAWKAWWFISAVVKIIDISRWK
jgi:hypothetical protein